jgi:ribonucleoside-diphosphate reductase alpha chain
MLNTIIKRDGSTEPFIASKLNKWSRWASKDIADRIDWSSLVLNAVANSPVQMTSQELQQRLIDTCLEQKTWPAQLMAGRLYTAVMRKKLFEGSITPPAVKKLHKKLLYLGLMACLDYSEEEYEEVEKIIDHARDFNLAHFQLNYILHKYTLQNRAKKIIYEMPQFTYMRMAMAVLEKEPKDRRMQKVKELYDHFSFNRINAPTPNYTNLGTPHHGLASCCLYSVEDNAKSLAIGDHIAYTETYMSAGIGSNLMTRSLADPVRGGAIEHQGKMPYYAALGKAIKANKQGSRGGACTTYFSIFDPEAVSLIMAQNPKTPVASQNRDLFFTVLTNRLFAKKVAANGSIFTFNVYTQPKLTELFYSDQIDAFEALYVQIEEDPSKSKNYVSARELLFKFSQQFYDTATMFHGNIGEINRHTPFNDPIYSSNLCTEITVPTAPYSEMVDLYSSEDHGRGEIGICTIAGIVYPNIKNDEQYRSAAYYALLMIDHCIDIADYELPHIKVTAQARRNAAVGLVGVATEFAQQMTAFDNSAGLELAHRIAERHSYFIIEAALQLGLEKGNASWMHKTKWSQGWLPIDTYKKQVGELVQCGYQYDWETLRRKIIENKGIRFSSLVAHMPTESSSKASGMPNGIYPVRSLALLKTDGSNAVDWVAYNNDLLGAYYQSAWDIAEVDLVKYYSVFQKFADQTTSADLYRDRTTTIEIGTKDMTDTYLAMMKYGMKTKYYTNSLTNKEDRGVISQIGVCTDGSCTI